jgi:hypothetical protein
VRRLASSLAAVALLPPQIAHGCEHAAASDHYPAEYRMRVITFLDAQIPN